MFSLCIRAFALTLWLLSQYASEALLILSCKSDSVVFLEYAGIVRSRACQALGKLSLTSCMRLPQRTPMSMAKCLC